MSHESPIDTHSEKNSEARHVKQSTSEYEMMDPLELATKNNGTPISKLNKS